MRIAITSGYFDPLHVGHLDYLRLSSLQADKLLVIVNNDLQAKIKKGKSFMSELDRLQIVKSIEFVDLVVLSVDKDSTVCETIRRLAKSQPNDELLFCKGGDRHAKEIPEAAVCKELGIPIIDGLGDKIRSSSDLVRSYDG